MAYSRFDGMEVERDTMRIVNSLHDVPALPRETGTRNKVCAFL